MASRRTAMFTIAIALTASVAWAADDKAPGQCMRNAFAAKLSLNDEQKEQFAKICSESEAKAAPVCEKMWKIHCEHQEAMLQILSTGQRDKLPEVMNTERAKVLDHAAKKLELTAEQRKQAEKICTDYEAKYPKHGDRNDPAKVKQYHELKAAQFEEFCKILTDDQRVKLPVMILEELQNGRTMTAKSEFRASLDEKLGLDAEQKTRCDKVCDLYAPKIDEQKAQLLQICKDSQAAVDKILNDAQRTKFQEFVKAATDK
jgi:Spy/CpxP family protein refolding chaperone